MLEVRIIVINNAQLAKGVAVVVEGMGRVNGAADKFGKRVSVVVTLLVVISIG